SHVSKIMIGYSQHYRLTSGRFLKCLAHILLLEQPITGSYIQAARNPSAAVARNLVIVGRRMIRRPSSWGAAPISETTARKPKLSRIHSRVYHGLAGEVEWHMLFQKPMAVRPDDVKPGSMGGRKTMLMD